MTSPNIHTLREHLMGTLASLRDRDNPMEPDRARAVAQVAGVLVDTARVEVDSIKATGQDVSNFIDGMKAPDTPQIEQSQDGPRTTWASVTGRKAA